MVPDTSLMRRAVDMTRENLLEWFETRQWRDRFSEYLDTSVARYAQSLNVTDSQLRKHFDSLPHDPLFNTLFQLFMHQTFEQAPHNVVDDFIRRQGRREHACGRQYLQQAKAVPMGLYEVIDRQPGEWLTLANRVVPAHQVTVVEKKGSYQIKVFQCLLCCPIHLSEEVYFLTNAIWPVGYEQADLLARELQDELLCAFPELQQDDLGHLSDEQLPRVLTELNTLLFKQQDRLVLEGIRPMFEADEETEETAFGEEDETPEEKRFIKTKPVMFEKIFPVADPKWVHDVLQAQDDMHYLFMEQDSMYWFWHQGDISCVEDRKKLGGIALRSDNHLVCFMSSASLLEPLVNRLQFLLGKTLGTPTYKEYTFHDFVEIAKAHKETGWKEDNEIEEDVSEYGLVSLEKEKQAFMSQMLTNTYRKYLDVSYDFFNGQTPKDHVKTEAGKERVRRWLLDIEKQSIHGIKLPDYDHRWLWDELGLLQEKSQSQDDLGLVNV